VLNLILLNQALQQRNVSIYYGHSVVDVDKSGLCRIKTSPDDFTFDLHFGLIIGADGAFSSTRSQLLQLGRVNHSCEFIDKGYIEVDIPPVLTSSGSYEFGLSPSCGLHTWPRGDKLLIALPNLDKTFTCTLFAPFDGPEGLQALSQGSEKDVLSYFRKYFPDVLPLLPNVAREIHCNPIGSMLTTTVTPWSLGPIVLIGDAAHAVLPFLGQGLNAAFEDAVLLYREIKKCPHSLQKAAATFGRARQPHADVLANLCKLHYEDMSVKSSSRLYHLIRRGETFLRTLLPKATIIPLYAMIAFTDMPYGDIVKRNRLQTLWITRALCGTVGVLAIAVWSSLLFYNRNSGKGWRLGSIDAISPLLWGVVASMRGMLSSSAPPLPS
jgi:kynurenine 3-monooxygenase